MAAALVGDERWEGGRACWSGDSAKKSAREGAAGRDGERDRRLWEGDSGRDGVMINFGGWSRGRGLKRMGMREGWRDVGWDCAGLQ